MADRAAASLPRGRATETMARLSGARSRVSPKLSSWPASGGAEVSVKSATQTLSFGINKMGRDNLDLHIDIVDRADSADDLARAVLPLLEKAKSDRITQIGRIGDGCHPALIIGHVDRVALRDEMRAGNKLAAAIHRAEAHQTHGIVAHHLGALRQDIAYAGLLLADHLAQTDIVGRGLTGKFVAGAMPLFDAHDAQRLGAIGDCVELFSSLVQYGHHRIAIARRYCQFERHLTGKRDPEKPRRRA